MPDTVLTWKGYDWMNGQPWGEAHPNPEIICYADKDESILNSDGSITLDINNKEKYFNGEVNHTKKFGCGWLSTTNGFLFGKFHFEYKLPKGIHLWPAIWLSGIESWPPEIDIMEGWSGEGVICKNKPSYQRLPLLNKIHPGIFYLRVLDKVYHKGYGNLGTDCVTYSWLQKLDDWNTCDLIWKEDLIEVYYNGHRVMHITENDKDQGFYMLDFMKKPMYVCLDAAVLGSFTQDDYKQYKEEGSPFIIREFTYEQI